MLINTKKEADEYFEHNPTDKRLFFVMLTESDFNRLGVDTENIEYEVDILKTEENIELYKKKYLQSLQTQIK